MSFAIAIATIVPVLALAAAVMLDRQRKQLVLVVLALCWGLASTELAIPMNDWWLRSFSFASLVVVGAPIFEEIVKSIALPVLAVSRRCNWFVDGALIGLASGMGFAIRENVVYLQNAPTGTAVSLAFARVTSTNLMHAGCTAIIGAGIAVTIGLPWWRRVPIALVCLAVSMSLHSVFNRLAQRTGTAVVVTLLGIAVFAIAAGIVALGSPLSRRWAASAMAARGHNAGERAMMGSGANVADLLDAFEARFGATATALLSELITVQRRIGVISHITARQANPEASAAQLDELTAEADQLRRKIGLIAMGWLRSHLPTGGASGMWTALADAENAQPSPGPASGLWAALADKEEKVAPRTNTGDEA